MTENLHADSSSASPGVRLRSIFILFASFIGIVTLGVLGLGGIIYFKYQNLLANDGAELRNLIEAKTGLHVQFSSPKMTFSWRGVKAEVSQLKIDFTKPTDGRNSFLKARYATGTLRISDMIAMRTFVLDDLEVSDSEVFVALNETTDQPQKESPLALIKHLEGSVLDVHNLKLVIAKNKARTQHVLQIHKAKILGESAYVLKIDVTAKFDDFSGEATGRITTSPQYDSLDVTVESSQIEAASQTAAISGTLTEVLGNQTKGDFKFEGTANVNIALQELDLAPVLRLVEGATPASGRVNFEYGKEGFSIHGDIQTSLKGIRLALPSQLNKIESTELPSHFNFSYVDGRFSGLGRVGDTQVQIQKKDRTSFALQSHDLIFSFDDEKLQNTIYVKGGTLAVEDWIGGINEIVEVVSDISKAKKSEKHEASMLAIDASFGRLLTAGIAFEELRVSAKVKSGQPLSISFFGRNVDASLVYSGKDHSLTGKIARWNVVRQTKTESETSKPTGSLDLKPIPAVNLVIDELSWEGKKVGTAKVVWLKNNENIELKGAEVIGSDIALFLRAGSLVESDAGVDSKIRGHFSMGDLTSIQKYVSGLEATQITGQLGGNFLIKTHGVFARDLFTNVDVKIRMMSNENCIRSQQKDVTLILNTVTLNPIDLLTQRVCFTSGNAELNVLATGATFQNFILVGDSLLVHGTGDLNFSTPVAMAFDLSVVPNFDRTVEVASSALEMGIPFSETVAQSGYLLFKKQLQKFSTLRFAVTQNGDGLRVEKLK